jgi:hypothetical protein
MRALALAVYALGLTLALTGCQVRVGVDVAVDRAGAGTLAVLVGADEELLAQARDAGVDPLGALLEQARQLAAAGWRVTEDAREGGGRQVRLTAGFDSPQEFNALASGLAGTLAAPELTLLEPLTLTLTDDRVVVTGAAGLEPTPAMAALGLRPDDAVHLIHQDDAVAYEVRVRLPGPVLGTTATGRDQDVLTWRIKPGERVEIRAVSERPGPSPLPSVLIGTVALVASAAGGAALVRRARATGPDRSGS